MSKKTDPTRPTDLGGTCFYVSAETLSLESPEFCKLLVYKTRDSTDAALDRGRAASVLMPAKPVVAV